MKKIARTLLLISAMLAGLQLGLYLVSGSAAEVDKDSLRQPATGPVLGLSDDFETHAWLGIPYAQSTAGDNRWRAPQALAPWVEPREALAFGDFCSQLGNPSVTLNPMDWDGAVVGSEDCLSVNIWAPRTTAAQAAKKKLPVMLWIHGGGNSIGRADSYRLARLAGEQQMVMVSINYRLGALGWYSHPALQQLAVNPQDASGNFGTLDMIAALEWLQDNIAAFGGDPERVTVFGESAGGRNVVSLLMSAEAKGLFHRAIVQSGLTESTTMSVAQQYRQTEQDFVGGRELLAQLILADGLVDDRQQAIVQAEAMEPQAVSAYLRSQSAANIIDQYPKWTLGMVQFPQLFRDGVVLPQRDFIEQLKEGGDYNAVPLITGANRDEYKMFLMGDEALVDIKFGLMREVVATERYEQLNRYQSDRWIASVVTEFAAALAVRQPGNVWSYRFDWDEGGDSALADYSQLMGAAHSLEIPFVLGQWQRLTLPGVFDEGNLSSREALSTQMRSYWGAFARDGDPAVGSDAQLTAWQPVDSNGTASWSMRFDSAADGGSAMFDNPLSIVAIKQRLQGDQQLAESGQRCDMYGRLFLHSRYWRDSEFEALCVNE